MAEEQGGEQQGGEEQRAPGYDSKWGNENKRFEEKQDSGNPFDGIQFPEKFMKDGKPDLNNFVQSYQSLEQRMNTKTEELREQIRADLYKDRPEKPEEYKVPDVIQEPDSPLIGWWREQAHEMGLGQEGFEKGITQFMERAASLFDPEEEKKKLGDNADARIEAVTAWANKTFTDAEESKVIQQIGGTAAGVKVLEKLMGSSGRLETDETQGGGEQLTLEKLRAMQQDPRYYDPMKRDRDFVKQVEEGYEKLYKKPA